MPGHEEQAEEQTMAMISRRLRSLKNPNIRQDEDSVKLVIAMPVLHLQLRGNLTQSLSIHLKSRVISFPVDHAQSHAQAWLLSLHQG